MPRKQTPADPAQIANAKVLADRQERLDAQMKALPDLGLGLDQKPAASAEEFFDEFDKKSFGDPMQTVTRIVYGPDPLIDDCPAMKERIEQMGLEAYADMTAQTILQKEHEAMPDPLMRKALFMAIRQFGKQKVAKAFAERILRIPTREVHYEVGGEDFGDPLTMGGNVLRDCVSRHGNEPGMSYRFLSPRCIDVLGLRGYTLVMHQGQPVKAGTLLLGKIPEAIAAGRARAAREESIHQVQEAEESYMESQARLVQAAGAYGQGSRPLAPGERFKGQASETEGLLDRDLEMGIKFERQQ